MVRSWVKMVDEQEFLDYPCRICERLNMFVSTLNPVGRWVCTECQHTIGDNKMKGWRKLKKKLREEGNVIRVGMHIKMLEKIL